MAFVKLAEYESITQHPVMSQHIGLLADRLVSVCTGVAKARGGFVMKTIHGMCMLYWAARRRLLPAVEHYPTQSVLLSVRSEGSGRVIS